MGAKARSEIAENQWMCIRKSAAAGRAAALFVWKGINEEGKKKEDFRLRTEGDGEADEKEECHPPLHRVL